ncbi:MAG: DUF4826 family protein [Gammaproteobacteria bacterium]|nr:DUF4826 family protein [Gammaproteobacteria bacterium]
MEQQKNTAAKPMTEAETQEWVRLQFQRANLHLAEQGIVMESVAVAESRYLPPLIAVWKIHGLNKNVVWAISGDVPVDYLPVAVAADAREAIKHFSYRWQMKAQQIMDNGISDQTSADYVQLLVGRANMLYDLSESETLWQAKA